MDNVSKITLILRQMGADATMRGYDYTIRSVIKIMEDESWLHRICQLSEEVAKEVGSTSGRVSKGILTLCDIVWNTDNGREVMEQLACHKLEKRPATGKFLEMLVFGVKTQNTPE